jgi:hypothetical protein
MYRRNGDLPGRVEKGQEGIVEQNAAQQENRHQALARDA